MRELLSNNSLFVGQLYEDKSIALLSRSLISAFVIQFLESTISKLTINETLFSS